jgi:histidinol-phosphate aminotransferase
MARPRGKGATVRAESSGVRIPEHIRSIQPYIPGTHLEEAERETGLRVVKLASNENPLGPSPLAVEAMRRALLSTHRYPDSRAFHLRQRLAQHLDVPEDWLLFGNGSTELIELAALAFLGEGDAGLIASGSFPMYRIALQVRGARIVEVPLQNYRYDLAGMARVVREGVRLVYLANPNNPTGTWFCADALAEFLNAVPRGVVVVLDEAYYEYVEQPGYSRSLEELRAGRHLIVLRTFSKIYGLAGLRIGYAVARPELLEAMARVRLPFNTSSLAQAAALAALDDTEHVRRSRENNRAGLAQLESGLRALGLEPIPSVANFVMVTLGQPAAAVVEALLQRGVLVRPLGWMGFPNAIRITVGTQEENQRLLEALAAVMTNEAAKLKEREAGR